MIRVVLPAHLRTLARVHGEVELDVAGQVTQRSVLDALEARYPALAGLAALWLAVGAALVWCDYHWFTDVVAGWALSGLLIQLTFWINRPRRLRAARSPHGTAAGN